MSYRRPDDSGVFSSRWRLDHQADLTACGIPDDVANSDRRWTYVLLHGYDPQTGWKHEWLSNNQSEMLLALLEPHLSTTVGIWLVEGIRRRLAKP